MNLIINSIDAFEFGQIVRHRGESTRLVVVAVQPHNGTDGTVVCADEYADGFEWHGELVNYSPHYLVHLPESGTCPNCGGDFLVGPESQRACPECSWCSLEKIKTYEIKTADGEWFYIEGYDEQDAIKAELEGKNIKYDPKSIRKAVWQPDID